MKFTFPLFTLVFSLALVACGAEQEISDDYVTTCVSPDILENQFVIVPSGDFIKGASPVYQDEVPEIRLHVDGFMIQTHEVTNVQFEAFVAATDYVTDAERSVLDNIVGAGSAVFIPPEERVATASPWTLVQQASWRTPEGLGSNIETRMYHPVVHVSERDAEAYANWAGGRLPNEVEWEYAASLGLPDPSDQISGAYGKDGPRANTWQGIFPIADTQLDGYHGTAAGGCFPQDQLGLYDMIGNVWEWTSTPYGSGTHTMKGGSYLCADNFCRRYRPAARHPQDTEFSSSHIGFRIVRDLEGDQE